MHYQWNVRGGRTDVRKDIEREFAARIGAMTVGVCGPGALADDVRAAARGVIGKGNVDFREGKIREKTSTW